MLKLFRHGAACRVFMFTLVGFIDWLGVTPTTYTICNDADASLRISIL